MREILRTNNSTQSLLIQNGPTASVLLPRNNGPVPAATEYLVQFGGKVFDPPALIGGECVDVGGWMRGSGGCGVFGVRFLNF